MTTETPEDSGPDFVGAILYCPVCCSPLDVLQVGWVESECSACGTEFKVRVVPEVIASYAMFG